MTTREVAAAQNGSPPATFALGREIGRSPAANPISSLYEEWLPALRGHKAIETYTEMSRNDAVVGGSLAFIDMLARQVEWSVQPLPELSPSEQAADEAAAWVQANMDGMSMTWADVISSALSMLPFGWSWLETVYERRDGSIMWRKHALRGQETLVKFLVDEQGGVQGMRQAISGGGFVDIPIQKSLHFTSTKVRDNPEGQSALRTVYRSWYIKKHLEDQEAITVERIGGVPRFWVPLEVIEAGAGDARYEALDRIGRRLRRDEQAYVMLPNERDETGERLYDMDMVGNTSDRQHDIRGIIQAYSNDIAMALFTEVMRLGFDAVGSRALADPKMGSLGVAIDGMLDRVSTVINRHGLQRLWDLNPQIRGRAEIVHSPAQPVDMEQMSNAVLRFAQAGHDFFADEEPNRKVRELLGFDPNEFDPAMIRGDNPEIGSMGRD